MLLDIGTSKFTEIKGDYIKSMNLISGLMQYDLAVINWNQIKEVCGENSHKIIEAHLDRLGEMIGEGCAVMIEISRRDMPVLEKAMKDISVPIKIEKHYIGNGESVSDGNWFLVCTREGYIEHKTSAGDVLGTANYFGKDNVLHQTSDIITREMVDEIVEGIIQKSYRSPNRVLCIGYETDAVAKIKRNFVKKGCSVDRLVSIFCRGRQPKMNYTYGSLVRTPVMLDRESLQITMK